MCYWRWFDGRYVYVLLVISNDCICTNICGVDEILYYPHSLLEPRRLFGRISRELCARLVVFRPVLSGSVSTPR